MLEDPLREAKCADQPTPAPKPEDQFPVAKLVVEDEHQPQRHDVLVSLAQ
jgi:hypothetical protein